MAAAAFPAVIGAIFTVADNAFSTVRVTRGRDISGAGGDVVMVGVQDLEASDWDTAGSYQQLMQTFGGNREEVGYVNGLIYANDGGGDPDAALSAATDYLDTLGTAVRANPTLGLTFEYVVAEFASGDVIESQNDQGAAAVLPFVISYKIRI